MNKQLIINYILIPGFNKTNKKVRGKLGIKTAAFIGCVALYVSRKSHAETKFELLQLKREIEEHKEQLEELQHKLENIQSVQTLINDEQQKPTHESFHRRYRYY